MTAILGYWDGDKAIMVADDRTAYSDGSYIRDLDKVRYGYRCLLGFAGEARAVKLFEAVREMTEGWEFEGCAELVSLIEAAHENVEFPDEDKPDYIFMVINRSGAYHVTDGAVVQVYPEHHEGQTVEQRVVTGVGSGGTASSCAFEGLQLRTPSKSTEELATAMKDAINITANFLASVGGPSEAYVLDLSEDEDL